MSNVRVAYNNVFRLFIYLLRSIYIGYLTQNRTLCFSKWPCKGPATRNDTVNDARADAIFATLKAIVDDEKSTISSTISIRVAATRNDFVNDIVNDARAGAIFATLKAIVDDIVTCGMALSPKDDKLHVDV